MAFTAARPISGKSGRVGIAGSASTATTLEITQWDASADVDKSSYGSSFSDGFKRTQEGNKVCTGTVQGKINEVAPISNSLDDGDRVALTLFVTQKKANGKRLYLYIPEAVIEKLSFASNQDTGEPAAFTFAFTSDGPYYWRWQA